MRKTLDIQIDLDLDFKFIAFVPAFNLNLHGGFTLEVEWLCLGLYINFKTAE